VAEEYRSGLSEDEVEEGVRRVSAEEATLYGAIIAGTFALLGVVIERLLRLLGRLLFESSVGELMLTNVADKEGYNRNVSLEEADEKTEADGMRYGVAIDLFNGKEVPTGLRDVRVELVRDHGRPIESRPDDLATGRLPEIRVAMRVPRTRFDKLDVLNIPPRQFVHKELRGEFGKDAAEALSGGSWRSIDFVGERPKRPFLGILGSKTYRKTITEPKDWPRR
jgi:hypothetical protein